jgi:hypothetical protein
LITKNRSFDFWMLGNYSFSWNLFWNVYFFSGNMKYP